MLLENVAKLKLEAVPSDEMSLFVNGCTYLHLRAREHAVSLRKVVLSQSPAKVQVGMCVHRKLRSAHVSVQSSVSQGSMYLQVKNQDSGQTVRVHRLIWISVPYAGYTDSIMEVYAMKAHTKY